MKKTFTILSLFLFYIEIVFHILCFNSISIENIIMTVLFVVPISIIFTFLCSLFKNKKINSIILKILCLVIVIIYISQIIYFKLYDSFFTYNSFVYLMAVKGGILKVLQTILENIVGIIIILIPSVFIMFKYGKDIERINLRDSSVFLIFAMLFYIYGVFSINTLDKDNRYSLYNLYYRLDIPVYSTKDFGLLTYLRLSFQRGMLNFEEKETSSEDIYTNEVTSLLKKVNIKYNTSNIDFDKLIKTENNKKIREIHEYISSKTPTKQNEYTGIFKGKNVIYILAESLSTMAIDKELTPTLYKMYNDGYNFPNYYSPKYPAGTADGEYMLEWGLIPVIGNDYSLIDLVYIDHPLNIATMFKNNGYKTHAYHNYYGYYNYRNKYFKTLDFDSYKFSTDMNISCTKNYHASDVDLINKSVDDFINDDKFFTYYISLSGHGDYEPSNNTMAKKNWSLVKNLKYSDKLKGYIASNIEFDRAMQVLLQKLEEAQKLDDTIIVISSDHSPYFLSDNDLKVGYNTSINKFSKNKGIFFVYSTDKDKKGAIDKYGMNMDVPATVYNLMGFDYDSRLLTGQDLMSDSECLVILSDRSFITSKGKYNSSNNKFIKTTKENISDNYVDIINNDIADRFKYSKSIQYNNYYKHLK